MSDSSEERASEAKEAKLVSIPEMPDLLEAAGLKRVGPARIRQLAAEPGFPAPAYERGRLRLWDWAQALEFFSSRVVRQGERTDLKRDQEDETDDPAGGGSE
ncbi:hypothetical protein DI272_19040 [Streptomyces sp. Act143]|uniref:hypothetical protein n=1 Tax=Streptomyces sp. Act143 TaxID=2200760 RepID=UPI000D6736DC|nr:hypothetical protein [Streptomyces sp. Act143]PWI16030.1 hypothetical protein DI272_19040 [Streptomyces sp. Act143]